MWYLILGADVDDSLAARREARPRHLARLQELDAQGRLKLAGPLPAIDAEDPGEAGFTGSVIIASFDSIDAAKAWAADDPYVHAGVYDTMLVKPYRHVLP
jgi:uncharacterized protein YciI